MDRWDMLIIFGAGYFAVTSLVRLMAIRRNRLVQQVRQQIEEQRQPTKKAPVKDADRGAA